MTRAGLSSEIKALAAPETDEGRLETEYLRLNELFEEYLAELMSGESGEDVLEILMETRAEDLIAYAIEAFGLSKEQAVEVMRGEDGELKEILEAAIDNLADFGVAEEYALSLDLEDIEDEEDFFALAASLCKKYNKTWANVENLDVVYSMMVAKALSALAKDTKLTYMTQGDDRVRPWHRAHEGFTAPKSTFPAWLIPPIEHQCRCFLVESDEVAGGIGDVVASKMPERPEWVSGVFKESVALGGRIFSDEHRYFDVRRKDKEWLKRVAERVKQRYR